MSETQLLILLDFAVTVTPDKGGRILSAPTSHIGIIAFIHLGFMRYVDLATVGADMIRPPLQHVDFDRFPGNCETQKPDPVFLTCKESTLYVL
ncbi:MAG: hypothetical protein IKP72_15885 [Clostridia bacterium]|nr:hypothetical protein [Clostridia bacterium]